MWNMLGWTRRGGGIWIEMSFICLLEKSELRIKGTSRKCVHVLFEHSTSINTRLWSSVLVNEFYLKSVLKTTSTSRSDTRKRAKTVLKDPISSNANTKTSTGLSSTCSRVSILGQNGEKHFGTTIETYNLRNAWEHYSSTTRGGVGQSAKVKRSRWCKCSGN